MKVLKATPEQKEAIESQTSGSHLIRFVLDANGNWIVGKKVLNDLKFRNILELQNLAEIEYQPQPTPDL